MEKFNLIDNKWILVLDEDGLTHELSLKELFETAHLYKQLAGEMKTQDFAILRILLAVLHTVFSRFNYEGDVYEYLEVDDKFRQIADVDEDDLEEYNDELIETWENLWNAGKFPEIVIDYLEKWHDRFYLFDHEYPFMQVSEKIIRENTKNSKGTDIFIKNINRTLSESNNKISLFASKDPKSKNITTESEIIRWIITYHGYTGTGDKTIFGSEKYEVPNSKGWLFDIGGIYLTGNTLYETLLLNLVLFDYDLKLIAHKQKPSWEYSPNELIANALDQRVLDNLAQLYTYYSRAIFIDPYVDLNKDFKFEAVKIPEINHQNQNLEQMTIWKMNESGPNKGTNTPRKHRRGQALWRSFGLVALNEREDNSFGVGLMKHVDNITDFIGEYQIAINAISMEDDGNATSWVPVNEIYDYLNIEDEVLTDLSDQGWVIRINDTVLKTKDIISVTYRRFLKDIKDIRNLSSDDFVNQNVEQAYFMLNEPFRRWLSSIKAEDSKEEKIFEWFDILEKIIRNEADRILSNANPRDFTGIMVDDKVKNIATVYNSFNYFLNNKLRKEA